MCGIFGWIATEGQEPSSVLATAQALTATLAHRGPDDAGYLAFPAAAMHAPFTEKDSPQQGPLRLLLGQTRLSIIDLSPAGHQPMRSADGRYALVYNGELYNYRELRQELQAEGHVFLSHTDTEVLLHALMHWGKDALPRLTGMFAFAFWDTEKRILLCARDCFGIKPLFWHRSAQGLYFASEIPALLQFPAVPRRVSPAAVYQYLCYGQYDVGGDTMLNDVYALPPAHYLEIALDRPQEAVPCRWWKPDIADTCRLSYADAARQLREMFLDSVRLHLRSDVPLGVALSGGIDSSSVTCAVRYLEPDADLHTFSFIAAGSDVSEEHWATLVARETRAIRHMVSVEAKELADDLDALLLAQGEPFGSTSIYAQYRVFQLAKECGIKVTLDGQGADELLAGYYGYPGPRIGGLLQRGQWAAALANFRAHKQWPGRSASYLAQQIIREFVPAWLMPLALRCIGRSHAPAWLDVAAMREQGVRLLREEPRSVLYPQGSLLKRTLATQLVWNGLPQLLRHGDRNAMAHSIESRVPFLTRDMAAFCMSLPEEYLVDAQGCSKSIFRTAMRGIVPDAILDRRDKIGFATPERQWLETLSAWVDSTLAEGGRIPYMDVQAAREEWQRVRAGQSPFNWRIWRWLCYTRWVQLFGLTA